MKANGHYFIVNSAGHELDPNQQKYASATSMDGPVEPRSRTWATAPASILRPAFVIPVQGSKTTTYIYAGDRWQDPDLKSSKYIWLPFKLSGDSKLLLTTTRAGSSTLRPGEWSAGDVAADKGDFVSHAKWSLVSVDSEETAAEDGHAINAFDDSTSTFWHTQWQDAQPKPPHEIVIDLGASYSVTGMRYNAAPRRQH